MASVALVRVLRARFGSDRRVDGVHQGAVARALPPRDHIVHHVPDPVRAARHRSERHPSRCRDRSWTVRAHDATRACPAARRPNPRRDPPRFCRHAAHRPRRRPHPVRRSSPRTHPEPRRIRDRNGPRSGRGQPPALVSRGSRSTSSADTPSGPTTSTIGSSRSSNSVRNARLIVACISYSDVM